METIDLSDLFNTRAQAEDFSARLEIILKQAFSTGFNPQKALLEQYGIAKQEAFMTLMRNNNVNPESRIAIKEFIEKIQLKIQSLTVISLVLAFEPTQQTLQSLSRWFILNTSKQVLFDIKVDASIIGGAEIMSGGKYLDYSIRPAFEKTMHLTLYGTPAPKIEVK